MGRLRLEFIQTLNQIKEGGKLFQGERGPRKPTEEGEGPSGLCVAKTRGRVRKGKGSKRPVSRVDKAARLQNNCSKGGEERTSKKTVGDRCSTDRVDTGQSHKASLTLDVGQKVKHWEIKEREGSVIVGSKKKTPLKCAEDRNQESGTNNLWRELLNTEGRTEGKRYLPRTKRRVKSLERALPGKRKKIRKEFNKFNRGQWGLFTLIYENTERARGKNSK